MIDVGPTPSLYPSVEERISNVSQQDIKSIMAICIDQLEMINAHAESNEITETDKLIIVRLQFVDRVDNLRGILIYWQSRETGLYAFSINFI